ncbi:hypothetical protein BpHYR1_000769 [Brachionus plicatilis]|uniref:Uncharacterized protein n=1 Tax=Brachionus plicatilis TaxID=10195 RepID=A0A3M7QMU0_BRAPC|nr:hypothetical protein BpHYR1_000769 [Brachionus plicatilis]
MQVHGKDAKRKDRPSMGASPNKNNRMGLGFEQKEAGIGMTKRVIIEIITDLDPTCKHHTSQMTNSKELKKNRRRPMERNICDQKEARATWRKEEIEWKTSLANGSTNALTMSLELFIKILMFLSLFTQMI